MANNGRKRGELPQPRSLEERDRARRLYEAGSTYRDVHETTGIPLATLRVWAKRDQWKVVESDFTLPDDSEEEEPIADDLPGRQEEYEDRMSEAAVKFARHVSRLDGDGVVRAADKIKALDQTARKALQIESEKPRCVIQIGVLASGPAKRALYSAVRPQKQLPNESESN